MDWPTVITVVLGSSVVSSLVTNAITLYNQNKTRNHHNSFLALTLAHELESYASRCADALSDHDLFEASKGAQGGCLEFPPEFKLAPNSDFQAFDLELLDAVLEFPCKVSFASDEVRFFTDAYNHEEASEIAYKNTATVGIEALKLAGRLRIKYKLSPRKLRFGKFNLKEALEDFKANKP